jgi:hypothetical protein
MFFIYIFKCAITIKVIGLSQELYVAVCSKTCTQQWQHSAEKGLNFVRHVEI